MNLLPLFSASIQQETAAFLLNLTLANHSFNLFLNFEPFEDLLLLLLLSCSVAQLLFTAENSLLIQILVQRVLIPLASNIHIHLLLFIRSCSV